MDSLFNQLESEGSEAERDPFGPNAPVVSVDPFGETTVIPPCPTDRAAIRERFQALPDAQRLPISTDGEGLPYRMDLKAWLRKNHTTRLILAAKLIDSVEADVRRGTRRTASAGLRAPNFSTRYAKEWGEAQGWKVIDSERFTHGHYQDCVMGVDVIFDADGQRIGVQGAGRYERAEHYQRFLDWGGVDRANRLQMKVIYLEFVRGNKTPVVREDWL